MPYSGEDESERISEHGRIRQLGFAHLGKFAKPLFIFINSSAQLHSIKSYLKPHLGHLQYLWQHVIMLLHLPLCFFLQTLLRFNLFLLIFLKFEACSKSVCLLKPLYSVLDHHNLLMFFIFITQAYLVWYKSGNLFPLNRRSCKSHV